jgi:competence protein ComEA
MVRPSRSAELEDRGDAHGRLKALRLRAGHVGWVPAPLAGETADELTDRDLSPARRGVPQTVAPVVAPVSTPQRAPTLGDLARSWALDRLPPWTHGIAEHVRRSTLLLSAALVAAAIVAGVVVLHHGSASSYSSYEPSGGSASVASSAASSPAPIGGADASSIVVDVGGRVRKPGLVTLPAGARVADAIAAAGGPLHRKEIAALNLAARVTDGQLLLVGVPTASTSVGGSDGAADPSSTGGPAAPVDLDQATIEELETLPGVGPVTAQKIIDWRTAHSGFTTVAQLQQVPGIGPARYAELSPLVTP